MSDFKTKMHQIRFRLGLRPRPRWGSLQRSPRPLATFKEGKGGKEKGRKGEGGEGSGEMGGEGRDGRGEEGWEEGGGEGVGRHSIVTHLVTPLVSSDLE